MEENKFWFDSFEVSLGPHGGKLTFNLDKYAPREPGRTVVAAGYTSLESLKSMAYVLARAVKGAERQSGVSYPIPGKVLNEWGVSTEDWEDFWK